MRRRIADQPASLHHQNAVGEQQRLGHVVGHEDGGQPHRIVQGADRLAQRVPGNRIERAKGFVHQQQSGPRGESPGDADTLALPARKRIGHPGRHLLRQIDQAQHLGNAVRRIAQAGQPQADGDILTDRQVREKADILKDIADPATEQVRGSASTATPSIVTRPALGAISRLTILSNVDLPEPEAPTSATKVPPAMVSETPSTARVPFA